MTARRSIRPKPALSAADLERLALAYVGRYATSRARLAGYLNRKLRERGWAGDEPPALEPIVRRFADLGYVDDRAVAQSRGRAMAGRGYGARRLDQSLHALGIADDDSEAARQAARQDAWETALRFARRRRLGPFATAPTNEATRRRAFGAMIRAGHPPRIIARILDAAPGTVPLEDDG